MSSVFPAHEFFQEVSRALAAMMTVISLLAACNLRGLDPEVRDAAKKGIGSVCLEGVGFWIASTLRAPRSLFIWSYDFRRVCTGTWKQEPLGRSTLKILTELGRALMDSHPGFKYHIETSPLLAL